MARRKDDGWIDLKADKRNTWLRILLIAAIVLLLGAALFLVLKGALAPREGQEPVAEKTPVVPHEARQESRLTLTLSPNESMRIGASTLHMEAVLTDLSGTPLGGRKIAFTYNDEWNYAYYARTDAQGRATYDMPIVNDLLRSGFCGAGGFRNTATGYQAVAYFQGDAEYTGSRATGMFMVGSGGDAIPTRLEVVSVPSQVSRGDSVTVRVRLLDTQGKPLPAGRTIYFSGFYRPAERVHRRRRLRPGDAEGFGRGAREQHHHRRVHGRYCPVRRGQVRRLGGQPRGVGGLAAPQRPQAAAHRVLDVRLAQREPERHARVRAVRLHAHRNVGQH